MKKGTVILLSIVAAVLFSCVDPVVPTTDKDPELGVTIEFPALAATRAEVGNLPASELENIIKSLSLWVFTSEEPHTLIASRDLDTTEFPIGGGIRRYAFPVSKDFANNRPDVDIFVLANAASIGHEELNASSDWSTLNGAFFTDSYIGPYYGFGLSQPVHSVTPSLGLPMSGAGKNMPILGEAPALSVETISLKRAVSRLRYVFCRTRTEGEEDDIVINRIVLNSNLIPVKEYVFTANKTGIVMDQADENDNYDDRSYTVPGPSVLAENDTPENLIYVNQDPQSYAQLLDDAVADGVLTDMGYTYFRETDRRLIGLVDYTVNGKARTKEFNMASNGDFARNHTWTLFGYFLSGRNLQLSLSVQPWDYNTYEVDFSEKSVNVSSKFTVDEHSVDLVLTSKDHYDAHLIAGKAAKGHIYITTPVGGTLMIRPVGDARAFKITPDPGQRIDPTVNRGRIDIEVRRNPDVAEDLSGSAITLSFSVEIGDRVIDANTEAVDQVFRFVL